ncbi:MAG TPA: hypothetical protein VIZ18_05030, partial [Ktedonobacteraceae bacterium]
NVSPADIAQRLVQLPRRLAYVRAGNDVGVIYTDDALPQMDEYTALGNYSIIKVQTRDKYCRQVRAADSPTINPNKSDDEPPIARWEELE